MGVPWRRLRYRGFKLSACGYAYYHPRHWLSQGIGGRSFRGPGDYWIYEDAFKARTPQARLALKALLGEDGE